jgi:hypothetical protein
MILLIEERDVGFQVVWLLSDMFSYQRMHHVLFAAVLFNRRDQVG